MWFRFPPSLTMMHLSITVITQCTYWTPLLLLIKPFKSEVTPYHTSFMYLARHIHT